MEYLFFLPLLIPVVLLWMSYAREEPHTKALHREYLEAKKELKASSRKPRTPKNLLGDMNETVH